ncbi:MAG: transglutaminase family protein [Myxococcales bacterium]|nr:transglutaminase family protein [Myxococcales bacterium]
MTLTTTDQVLGTTLLEVTHHTLYRFPRRVTHCRLTAHLNPQDTEHQLVRRHSVTIDPTAEVRRQGVDARGNLVLRAEVDQRLDRLEVTASTFVELCTRPVPAIVVDVSWELVAGEVSHRRFWPFLLGAQGIPLTAAIDRYARACFQPGWSLGEGLIALLDRIGIDFADNVESARRGGKESAELAGLTIACLRAVGLPARFVSGYRVHPATQHGTVHSWVQVWTGGSWLSVDPTLGRCGRLGHLELAQGRDALEVAPLAVEAAAGGRCLRETTIRVRHVDMNALLEVEGAQESPAA